MPFWKKRTDAGMFSRSLSPGATPHLLRIALLMVLFAGILNAQEYRYGVLSYTESAWSDTSISRYFESWNDVYLERGPLRAFARLGAHNPAADFAQQADSRGLEQRYLSFQSSGWDIRLGHFYSLLGRGLTLRSFESRTLRWDSNLDGLRLAFRHDYFSTQLFAGKPRKTRLSISERDKNDPPAAGERLPAQYGGEVRIKPLTPIALGGTYVYSDNGPDGGEGFSRGSLFAEGNFLQGSFYGEVAALPYPAAYGQDDGRAAYFSGNLFLGNLILLGEYKYYRNFGFFDGLLNNPPSVIREHLYTLLNRHQLVQNANDEQGYLVEMSYPVLDRGVALWSFSQTEDSLGNVAYRDFYGQVELDQFLGGEWVLGSGQQREFSRRYWNLVSSASYPFRDYYALKVVYEHLYARDDATFPNRRYYDQLLTIGLSKAPGWTLSFIGEHSTDHTVGDNYVPGQTPVRHFYWGGGQLDLSLFGAVDLSLFAGSRRAGKVCIGGVCVVKPELKGVEVTLTVRR